MAEVIIPDIMKALKSISDSNADNLHIRYDKEADVMYVSFGPPVPADDSELGEDDILYRYKDGEVVGLTVTHFSNRVVSSNNYPRRSPFRGSRGYTKSNPAKFLVNTWLLLTSSHLSSSVAYTSLKSIWYFKSPLSNWVRPGASL